MLAYSFIVFDFFTLFLCTCKSFKLARLPFTRSFTLNSIVAPDLAARAGHEGDGEYLKQTIITWLNTEYIDQPCHYVIAQHVKDKYIELRKNSITDAGEIMVEIGTNLESYKSDFDKSFVGPWDIANKVSDLMFILLESPLSASYPTDDSSAAATKVDDNSIPINKSQASSPTPTTIALTSTCNVPIVNILPSLYLQYTEDLSNSMFTRYSFLKKFLEGIYTRILSYHIHIDRRL